MVKKTPSDDCAAAIGKAAGGKLTADEVNEAFARVDAQKDALLASGQLDGMADRLRSYAEREAERTRIAAAMQRRHVGLNALVRDRLDQSIKTYLNAGLKPHQAILALIEGTSARVEGGRSSVWALKEAFEQRFTGGLMADLAREIPHFKNGLLEDARFDADTAREMAELREGGQPGITGNTDAKKAARIFANYLEMSRTEANRLGASIGKLDGYAGPQTHDPMRMLAVGKEQWTASIMKGLDLDRTFPDVDGRAEMQDALGDMFDTLITGLPNAETARELGQRVNPANLAKSLGKSRVLHFKDADAALAYREDFGLGGTFSGVFNHLRRVASVTAQMEQFGPNPEIMVGSLIDTQARLIKEAPTSEAERASLVERFDRERANALANKDLSDIERERAVQRAKDARAAVLASRIIPDADKPKLIQQLRNDGGAISQALDVMTGLATRPVSVTGAQIASTIRSGQRMAKLGGVVATALPTDAVTNGIASQMRGGGFLNGFVSHLDGLRQGRPEGELQEITFLMGEGHDGYVGQVVSPHATQDGPIGYLSRLEERFFKYNLLSWATDVARGTAARVIGAEMGMRAKTAFGALPKVYRDLLTFHSILEPEWDAIRQAKFRAINDKEYVTVDRVRALDDDTIEPLVAERLATVRKSLKVDEAKSAETGAEREAKYEERRQEILGDGRRQLELKVAAFIADETSYGVLETDARSQRTTTLGTRPGTLAGEALRSVMQFKGFPIAFGQRIGGRTVAYLKASDVSAGDKAAHIGTLLSSMVLAGYASIVLKDTAKGYWPPRDPADPRVWLASFQQAGALGIYGDYLFGESNRFGGGVLGTVAGPTIGSITQIVDLYQKTKDAALDPDKKISAADYMNVAIGNTPYANLIYVKPALDYLILNSVREMSSPGYLRRQDRRREREYGQTSLIPKNAGVLQ